MISTLFAHSALKTGIWTDTKRRSALDSTILPVFIISPDCRYVAKVIFTYILGYKVDVGHMEAVNLISSPKYSEKQIVWQYFCLFLLLIIMLLVGLPCCYTTHA